MNQEFVDHFESGIADIAVNEPGPGDEVELLHKVGPFSAKAVENAIRLLYAVNEQVGTDTVEKIDPRFILARAWSKSRLEQSEEILWNGGHKDTEDLPLVYSVYLLGLQEPYYLLGGGDSHYVVAARVLNLPEIRVRVGGYCYAKTELLAIEGHHVYFWVPDSEEWKAFSFSETEETIRVLKAFGVESKQTVTQRLKRLFSP
jgi:hypothetical protein